MNTQPESTSGYWVEVICNMLEKAYPNQELTISSGISPSGPYHLGHAREVLTAEAIVRGMALRGRKVRHTHFVDCFDALRKRYPYLPPKYEEEAGKPLFLVPAPDGKSKNYAQQYFQEYLSSTKELGIEMEVIWAPDEYQNGTFANIIRESLLKKADIAALIEEVSGRELPPDWMPIQILDESNNSLRTAKYLAFDDKTGMVSYKSQNGKEYQADIALGQVKLDWRVDWPARWKIWGNQIEGFGRDHATKGGSYDTGKAIIEKIYDAPAPFPIPYENINLKGDTKKMSSSLGNLVTIADVLQIIPAEILRFFTFKSKPDRQLFFDPTIGLYNLIDEYAKIENETLAGNEPEFKEAWQISNLSGKDHVISNVPFSHLVTSYQTAAGSIDEIFAILERSGHKLAVKNQAEVIKKELQYVKHWLQNYAPESVVFAVLDTTPDIKLSSLEEYFLQCLIDKLKTNVFEPNIIHETIYDVAVDSKLGGKEAFTLLYQLFIGKDSGPRAGYFLASLGQAFVLKRIADALQIKV